VAVFAGAASSQFTADGDGGNVADANRYAISRRNHHVADVGDVFKPAAGADHDALAIALDRAGATAQIIGFQRMDDISE